MTKSGPVIHSNPDDSKSGDKHRMSSLGKIVVVTALFCCVGFTVYAAHRTNLTQLLTLPLCACFLAAVIAGIACIFYGWRQRRWRSFLPFSACIIALLTFETLVPPIRHAIFTWSLPSYEVVVRKIESGEIPVSASLSELPQANLEARLTYAVFAQKDAKGILTVEFDTECGFPLMHSGYLYCSSGIIEPGSFFASRWPIRHEKKPNWFYVSN